MRNSIILKFVIFLLLFLLPILMPKQQIKADHYDPSLCTIFASWCCDCGRAAAQALCSHTPGQDINPYVVTLGCNSTTNSACSTTQYCSAENNPGTTTSPGTPPGCTITSPSPAPLSQPANGSIIGHNSPILRWGSNSFGNGCPNNNRYELWISQSYPSCTTTGAGWYAALTNLNGGTTQATLYDIPWGQTYCWAVVKRNGSATATSAVWTFSTNTPPTVTSAQPSSAFTCTANNIGRSDQADATNPVTFRIQGTDIAAEGDTGSIVGIALTPTSGTYAENGSIVDGNIVVQKARDSNSINAFYALPNNTMYMYRNTGWQGQAVGTNFSNNSNTATVTTGTGSFFSPGASLILTGDITIRFNNSFPNGTYNVYGYVATRTNYPFDLGSNTTNVAPFRMRRFGTVRIDTVAPTVTVGGPTEQGTDRFSISWNASDTNGINTARGYAYSTQNGNSIYDEVSANTINLPSSELSYPDAANANINSAATLSQNLGLRTYQDQTPGSGDYSFKLAVRDAACNVTESSETVRVAVAEPWTLAYGGAVGSGNGLTLATPPNRDINLTNQGINVNGIPYIVYDSLVAGGSGLPDRAVRNDQIFTSYDNEGTSVPSVSLTENWYEHLLSRVDRNGLINLENRAQTTISGNTSNYNSGSTDIKASVFNNNVTVQAGTVCNNRSIFFINGNLTINPSFTNANTQTACMFIVSGNVVVNGGSTGPAVGIGSPANANYDTIDSYIITDGDFTVNNDSGAAGNKWESLRIRGGVYSKGNVSLLRDLNTSANNTQPAQLFIYDPRFKFYFANQFAGRSYSVREILD